VESDRVSRRALTAVSALTAILALTLTPAIADAHLVTTGLGPVYDGLVHFALTPEDLIPALALALLAGLRGASHGRRALFVLPAAWLLGGVLGLTLPHSLSAPPTAISFIFIGALVAADAHISLSATTALAATLGATHGYLNGAALTQPPLAPTALLGIATAVFTLVALTASTVVPLRAAWSRIIVRVAGSWIAAIGLLLFGWSFRPPS
jgi:hydrogenase/urease accessory protein HupE